MSFRPVKPGASRAHVITYLRPTTLEFSTYAITYRRRTEIGRAREKRAREKRAAIRAVTADGLALQRLSQEMRRNIDVVKTAVTQNGLALQFAAGYLKRDYDIVYAAVYDNPWALQYASEELRDTKRIVCDFGDAMGVERDGMVLQFASARLRGDPEVAKSAVQDNGMALQFALPPASETLRVVWWAEELNPDAMQFMSERMKRHLKIRHIREDAEDDDLDGIGDWTTFDSDAFPDDYDYDNDPKGWLTYEEEPEPEPEPMSSSL